MGELDGLVGHDHRANDPQRLSPAAAMLPTALAGPRWLYHTRLWRPSARERPMCQHPEFFRPPSARCDLLPSRLSGPRPTWSLAQHHRHPLPCGRAPPSTGAQRRSAALRVPPGSRHLYAAAASWRPASTPVAPCGGHSPWCTASSRAPHPSREKQDRWVADLTIHP